MAAGLGGGGVCSEEVVAAGLGEKEKDGSSEQVLAGPRD